MRVTMAMQGSMTRAAFACAVLWSTGCPSESGVAGRDVGAGVTGGASGAMAGAAPIAGTGVGGTENVAGATGTFGDMAGASGTFGDMAGMGGTGVAGMIAGGAGGELAGTGGMMEIDRTEVCYEFRNHGQPISGDTSKYPVPPGEQYVCNHYVIPWTGAMEMTRYETIYDNEQILHHWLLYDVPGGAIDGTFSPCIGTHVLQDAQLVAGWAVGSNDVEMPPDVGLKMPSDARSFLLEWHFFNSSPVLQEDGSGIRVCVVPEGTRAKSAGMTWLGTEFFNGPLGMPPGVESSFGGTCFNNSGAPITIFRMWPHMHQWGRHMTSMVTRAATGLTESVFDQPFDFNYQISYESNIVLMPGDAITSTCRFHNMSAGPVAFGPSSNQEMCYQFAFSYPAGALDNGVLSLVGANNTCW